MGNKSLSYKAAAIYAAYIYLLIFLIVAIVAFFGRSVFIPTEEEIPHTDLEFSPWMPIAALLWIYFYLFMLFVINFKILESRMQGKWKTLFAILATLATTIVLNYLFFTLSQFVLDIEVEDPRVWIGNLVRDLFFAIIVIVSSQIIYLTVKRQKEALEYETMKAENARSRFEALKNQLDPHFLFNTFNTLDSLIKEDTNKAHEYLHQLSAVFRYVMPNVDMTSLREELKFTHDYNALMEIRYEDSLVFDFKIDERYLEYKIVPLSVQTLVENAIKHNVLSEDQPLVITISTGQDDTITVCNPIQKKKTPDASGGIGLSNLAERFRLKFQKEIEISNTNGLFAVSLPLIPPGE